MKKQPSAFEQFDRVMGGLLAVPYSELQQKLAEEKRAKAKKQKRSVKTASARASAVRRKHAV